MSEPTWIESDLVAAIHDRQLAEHGGGAGLRSESLLHSALGRPLNHFHYNGADVIDLAAQAILRLAAGMTDEIGFRDFLRANVKRA